MSQRTQAVLFDHEGTLVDFQWRLAEAEAELRAAFAALGYATTGSYAQLWNAAAARALAEGKLEALRARLYPIYDRWDADALTRWQLRPGAAELLDALRARGLATALISNCGRAAIRGVLSRFRLEERLQPSLGREDVEFMKPHPQGIQRALTELGLKVDDVLFVGDSLTDVRAARAAGVRVAIIRGGECAEAEFAQLPPDHFVDDLAEIEALASR